MSADYKEKLPAMIKETCVAEFSHAVLAIGGLECLKLWPGFFGALYTAIYIIFGNVPYIIIQRYNRPRLVKLLKSSKGKEKGSMEA